MVNRKKLAGLFLVALMVLGTTIIFQGCDKQDGSKENLTFTTEYQAVILNNGQYFFGKLEKAGSAYPVMRDIIYVRQQINPETKEMMSTLYKRSKEPHAPDMMYINANAIAFMEPVSPDSKMAKLIAEAKYLKPEMAPPAATPKNK